MPLGEEDKALIKIHLFKGYGSRRLLAEFPMINWTKAMQLTSNPIQCDATGAGSPLCPHLK